MLKHMTKSTLAIILQLFDNKWFSRNFPKDWSHLIFVPIYKPGKLTNLSSSCKPNSLTSSLCKIIGKIIVRKLNWYLERNDLKLVNFNRDSDLDDELPIIF